jgi:uncharacterized protein involved in high-affinity Fe2+ transport
MDNGKPPQKSSEEANAEQLGMAREEGKAYIRSLKHMAKDVANAGGEKRAGDYMVAYAIEKAEGMYHRMGGKLMWHEPEDENVHIEISVRDGADNRFIPYLTVTVTVKDSQGKLIGSERQPFIWHPWLYHYGLNWRLPADDRYTLQVQIDAPSFMRHDEINGKRYQQDVKVVFEGVKIKIEEKKKPESNHRRIYHVTYNQDEKIWKVKLEGAERASSRAERKQDAIDLARKLAKNQMPSSLVIHNQDGTIYQEMTSEEDPYSPV